MVTEPLPKRYPKFQIYIFWSKYQMIKIKRKVRNEKENQENIKNQ